MKKKVEDKGQFFTYEVCMNYSAVLLVADALEVFGDEQQVGAGGDRARVGHHVGQQLAEDAVVVLVDLLVALPDRAGAVDVAGGEGGRVVAQRPVRLEPGRDAELPQGRADDVGRAMRQL